ncbi:hypothetical protein ACIF83_35930 [Streptomyces sp. NPDC085866]|uniref:hypothetical protein n=1 Tax=Streptomyces sp. NPDC085866 TaxID=3365736 RepID=UPI0037D0EB72
MAVVVLLIAGIALAIRGGASGGRLEAAVDPLVVEIRHSSEGSIAFRIRAAGKAELERARQEADGRRATRRGRRG